MILGTALIVVSWVVFHAMNLLPLWVCIVFTVLGAIAILFGLLFTVYFFNLDSKLLACVQKGLDKVYNKRKRNRHLE